MVDPIAVIEIGKHDAAMDGRHQLNVIFMCASLAIIAPGSSLSRQAAAQNFPGFEKSEQERLSRMAFVENASARWAKKTFTTVEQAMASRDIQVMHFQDKSCVQFVFNQPAAGGVPIYCYRASGGTVFDPLELVFELSDVE